MGFPTYNTLGLIDRLTALNAAGYPADPTEATIHLYGNDVSPDAGMQAGTFELLSGGGLDPQNCMMGAPSLNDQGLVVSKSGLINFTTEAGDDPITAYGVVITNHTYDKVIAAQRFDTPQQLGGPYPQAVTGVWRSSEPLTNYGWIDVEA